MKFEVVHNAADSEWDGVTRGASGLQRAWGRSKHLNVSWVNSQWGVSLHHQGKAVTIGSFEDEESAANVNMFSSIMEGGWGQGYDLPVCRQSAMAGRQRAMAGRQRVDAAECSQKTHWTK